MSVSLVLLLTSPNDQLNICKPYPVPLVKHVLQAALSTLFEMTAPNLHSSASTNTESVDTDP